MSVTTFQQVANEARSKQTGSFGLGATELALESYASFPATFPFRLAFKDGPEVGGEKTVSEVVTVSAKPGGYTVARAQEATSESAHSAGAEVELMVLASHVTELQEAVNAIQKGTEAGGNVLPGYAVLAGRSGGQTLKGGTGSGQNLTLESTANATKGKIAFGTSAYNEALQRLGIGTTSPTAYLHVTSTSPAKVVGESEIGNEAGFSLFVAGVAGGLAEGGGEIVGGEGSKVKIIAGEGGQPVPIAETIEAQGGPGGRAELASGQGGQANNAGEAINRGGNAGPLEFRGATGGTAQNSSTTNIGGVGGTFVLKGGVGGSASGGAGTHEGGAGGGFQLEAGGGGAGATKEGNGGSISFKSGTGYAGGTIEFAPGKGNHAASESGKTKFGSHNSSNTPITAMEISGEGGVTVGYAAGKLAFFGGTLRSKFAAIPEPAETLAGLKAFANEVRKLFSTSEGYSLTA